MEAQQIRQRKGISSTVEGGSEKSVLVEAKPSLLVKEMLEHLSSDRKALMSGRELQIWPMSAEDCDLIRKQQHIIVDGDEIPPPITNFEDLRFPEPILKKLKEKGIMQPTPIQVQGLPVILSGRDMIGICFTGSGKTLVFALPLIMLALQQEIMMPIAPGEGPFGLVICPSREFARRTYDVVEEFLKTMTKENGYPELRSLLCIGGVDMWSQLEVVKKGVHIVVATLGRLKDLLATEKMNLDNCRYLTLDKVDTLFYMGFEDDVREVLDQFKAQRQTLLFSASTEFQDFARSALVMPVTVNVGIGKEGVTKPLKNYDKVLESLKETLPPALILCGEQTDVDAIHIYLLRHQVDAVAIHAGKSLEQIEYAVSSFKASKHDVLVATDAASEGLDLPDIQHVINYNMPAEIENRVHRIVRRGRFATTHINKSPRSSGMSYLDLKRIFQVAKRKKQKSEDSTGIGQA